MEENTNITNVEEIEEVVDADTEPEVLEETEADTTEIDVTIGVMVSAVALVALAAYGTYTAGKQAVHWVKGKIEEGKEKAEARKDEVAEKKETKALTRKQRREVLRELMNQKKEETDEQ